MNKELRQPECFYDQAHCSAFCGEKKKGAASVPRRAGASGPRREPAKLGSTAEQLAGSSLQAIRLVRQVQVLQLAQHSFVASLGVTVYDTFGDTLSLQGVP